MKPLFKYHLKYVGQSGQEVETYGVYGVLNNSKVLDGIYDVDNKVLKLLFDSPTEQYSEEVVVNKGKQEVQTRKSEQYYKGIIQEKDIPAFLETYVENNFEFSYSPIIQANDIIIK